VDQANPFESRNTYRLHRGEYLLWLAIVTGLFAYHIRDVRWLPAVALFLYIDLVGYIPGAIAYHRSSTKHISKVYYVLYNTMHSMITQTVVVGLWGLTIGWEWALLIVPFHIFGDRALFGNFLKPFALDFEPVPFKQFETVSAALNKTRTTRAIADTSPASPVPPSLSVSVRLADPPSATPERY
jgi:hypothetical protein